MRLLTFGAAFVTGCFSPSPQAGAPCATNGDCPSPLVCSADDRCEKPGSSELDACPANACDGDDLVGCGTRMTCAAGCAPVPAPHCRQLVPSNGVPRDLLDGADADVTRIDLAFNTTTGEIKVDAMVFRPAGAGVMNGIAFQIVDGLAIWAANSWTSSGASGNDWEARGVNEIVLLARTTIDVTGTIDVGGTITAPGPGASGANNATTASGCRGRAGRANAASGAAFGEGGGGGGAIHVGGDGGASNVAGPTGLGGTLCPAEPSTIPLRGGSGGGNGAQDATNSAGGGGGGGLMLVALEAITITGIVASPGGPGVASATGAGGGGGGGSGGAVLLEAPIVNITGAVTANGGGGGAPAGGADGNRGALSSANVAPGGAYSCVTVPNATPITRRGGAGGTGTTPPASGATCTQQDAGAVVIASQGGGGGGAAGRIEIRRLTGTTTGTISPPAVTGTAVVE